MVRACEGGDRPGSFGGPPRVNPPKEEDYGALVTYIWDPAGVLLHMAQPLGRTAR